METAVVTTENNCSGRSEEAANKQPGVLREVFTSESRGELSFAGQVEL